MFVFFVQKSIKSGRCAALNQHFTSLIVDEVFIIISAELGIKGNVYGIFDKKFQYTNKHRKY